MVSYKRRMRFPLLSFFLFVAISPVWSSDVITASEAAQKVGEFVLMRAVCVQVADSPRGTVFLKFEGANPKEAIFGYVAPSDFDAMGGKEFLQGLKGKLLEVQGDVVDYKGTPRIAITNLEQLKVVSESESGTETGNSGPAKNP